MYSLRSSYRILGGVWFSYRDHRRRPGQDDYWGFRSGLLRYDRSEKPAWRTFSPRSTRQRPT